MENVADAEIVIGIVGRIGVDTGAVSRWIAQSLHALHYTSNIIKITDYLKTKTFNFKISASPIETRYDTYISACDHIREKADRNDFFVSYAIQKIRFFRAKNNDGDPDLVAARTAYIVDQIKRPEEAEALRRIYGRQFILISCHMPTDIRVRTLAQKIADDHASAPRSKQWEDKARELIEKDEKESAKPFGQRVSDVFPTADLILDTTTEAGAKKELERFFEALFGNFKISPTRKEFFQNIAFHVSLTSCDTARQVGAVIEKDGEIVATGFNEAPKAFGGTYWADEGQDARDVALGKDANTVRKRQMVTDIVKRLRDAGHLSDNDIPDSKIEEVFLNGTDAPLKKSQIMDTLEYGRAVHAEMAALSCAARQGRVVNRGTLFCTTFPCHNCAKHIVASGIDTVYFLEPYAKSFADDLYPDSIAIDQAKSDLKLIKFQQFTGITPNRFRDLFAKENLKNEKGQVREWDPKDAQPILRKLDQAHTSREVLFQKHMRAGFDEETARYLGLDK